MRQFDIARLTEAARQLLGGAVLAGFASVTLAQSNQSPAAGLPASPISIENKLKLVERQLTQAPGVVRIRQSGNEHARAKLEQAELLQAKAKAHAAMGQLDQARRVLDEALREIMAASSLVPNAAQHSEQLRVRNAELREGIGSFRKVHAGIAHRLDSAKVKKAGLTDAESGSIDSIVANAATWTAQGRHQEANALLTDAHQKVVAALNRMLASETIIYRLGFDSPAEEYQHELARNQSYEELIPIALSQLKSTAETTVLTQRFVQQSRSLRESAQKRAGSGDYPVAVKTIQNATEYLQRSLRAAGVFVPDSLETSQ